jgi:putative transposase
VALRSTAFGLITGTPHFGGHIEELIGTTMGAVHLLPGTTFSNVAEKGAYSSEKTSALTLVELERWLALQVGGVHHQSVHAPLLKPSVAAWEDGLARWRKALRKPEDPQTFFLDFLPEEWRLIRRDGIQMFNIHYWDNVLSPLAGRSSKPVDSPGSMDPLLAGRTNAGLSHPGRANFHIP